MPETVTLRSYTGHKNISTYRACVVNSFFPYVYIVCMEHVLVNFTLTVLHIPCFSHWVQ